jgi:hypothetical protein
MATAFPAAVLALSATPAEANAKLGRHSHVGQ